MEAQRCWGQTGKSLCANAQSVAWKPGLAQLILMLAYGLRRRVAVMIENVKYLVHAALTVARLPSIRK
jgi:hypothetical protein